MELQTWFVVFYFTALGIATVLYVQKISRDGSPKDLYDKMFEHDAKVIGELRAHNKNVQGDADNVALVLKWMAELAMESLRNTAKSGADIVPPTKVEAPEIVPNEQEQEEPQALVSPDRMD